MKNNFWRGINHREVVTRFHSLAIAILDVKLNHIPVSQPRWKFFPQRDKSFYQNSNGNRNSIFLSSKKSREDGLRGQVGRNYWVFFQRGRNFGQTLQSSGAGAPAGL